ncbi:pescadillo homolog [Phalaenopsis equestris]|uniref:pescadillo homolog n=1 Tax=Phalaenopsis equestris TaxID=78828 RepID=UPI0009E33C12|nr:pescadillo homolog [Phalaenopsis equestris]
MPKHYRPPGKKKEGTAARFITRTKAVHNLQVSLPLFRKLCILKGVFPREPKKKIAGSQKTYYHVKDINFLMHEPLRGKLWDIKAYKKKIKKAQGKKNKELVERLLDRQPTYKLDRLVLERYPTFVDALRDLDDCLTMVHLFAALPAIENEHIQVDRIHNCRRLSHEWQAYISRTHCLRKTFISVKGIYYQAEVEGQKITWLTPHALQQVLTDDVDFNVMLTFLEFYEALLGFVNFRLYHSINVKYPPILDPQLEALAAELYALYRYIGTGSRTLSGTSEAGISSHSEQADNEKMNIITEASDVRLAQLQYQLPTNERGALMNMMEDVNGVEEEDQDTKVCKSLFKDFKFFLSREVPRESLLFIIPAFGGLVSWEGDGAPFSETYEDITHQIVDRPSIGRKFLSREYVQPQWIYDCINARIILPTEQYLLGRVPPPHLSPFVDNEAEGYVPEYAETIKRLQAAARRHVLPLPGSDTLDLADPQSLLAEGVIDRAEANEAAEQRQKLLKLEQQYHDELNMELQGVTFSAASSRGNSQIPVGDVEVKEGTRNALDQVAADELNLSKVSMSRKQRGLMEAIQIGKERKKSKIELLKKRKKEAEANRNG